MIEDLSDPRRSEPVYLLGEREMLEAWLEFHRMTLLLKCEGLEDAARKARPIESSLLSLQSFLCFSQIFRTIHRVPIAVGVES